MTSEITETACHAYLGLSKVIGEAVLRSDQHAKATHERFNVFSTLLKESDEVRLHTRFLHCLLDPKGTHDCGSLFLDLFFETLRELKFMDHEEKPLDSPIPMDERKWMVSKEASHAGYGQIDLLLESLGFGIAIENKIYAGEQAEQLTRYKSYLENRHRKSFALIYLTLDGKQSFTAGEHHYYRIFYKHHILAWLDSCLRATYHIIPINQALIQYRAVVRRLTNQTLESKFMKPVIDFVRKNPQLVQFNDAIQEAVRQASYDAWARLKESIKETFGGDYEVSIYQEMNWGVNSRDVNSNAALILKSRSGNGLLHMDFPVWIEPDFINDKCLGIGICTDGIELQDSMITFLEKVRFEMEKLPRHGYWNPKDGKPRFPVGWRNLMEGTYAEQSAQILSEAKILPICEDIRDYLKKLMHAIEQFKA